MQVWPVAAASGFTFAAYGKLLAVHGATGTALPATAALTSLGYSGEHFDAKAQQQYLRARWYDPASGRFNRLDPFAGDTLDPQSLHKYAYVHGDPLNAIDPTGESILSVTVSIGTRAFIASNTLVVGYGAAKAGHSIGAVISGLFITQSMTLWEAGEHLRDAAWEIVWIGLGLVGVNQATLRGASWLTRLQHTKILSTLASNASASRSVRGAAAFIQGRIAELYIAQKYVMWRNTANIGRKIPDFIGRTAIREVKNVARLQWTNQIATFANRALRDGKVFVVHVRPDTAISPSLLRELNNLAARGLNYQIIRDIPNALRVL